MFAIIGDISLTIVLLLALATIMSPILLIFSAKTKVIKIINMLIAGIFVFLSLAFFTLIYSFVKSDFSLAIVANNSHTLKPMLYKVTGSWGNHEGSMLLWLWLLAFITWLFKLIARFEPYLKMQILVVQAWLIGALSSFVIFTSNPFERLHSPPSEGLGLNPLLQDIGLASHPPALYLGYVGCSIAFSAAIIALLNLRFDQKFVDNLRPWILLSWSFLTLGITLGSWWAYRELGWGGFWFWDPVENSSLMPWLSTTALMHMMTLSNRQIFVGWSLILAIISFCLSLLGTFLVRSNILTSVHSFASDPLRGFYLLLMLAIISTMACLIFSVQISKFKFNFNSKISNKVFYIIANNILLSTACFTVIIGTLYPIIYQSMSGRQITVGAPYYNMIFSPLVIVALVLLMFSTIKKIKPIKLVLLLSAVGSMWLISFKAICDVMLLAASSCLIILLVYYNFAKGKKSIKDIFGQLFKLPLNYKAMVMAHIAFAILTISIVVVTTKDSEYEKHIRIGDKFEVADYQITLQDINYTNGANYFARKTKLYVEQNKNEITTLYPETRYYPVERSNTTESAIYSTFFYDLYAVIGDYNEQLETITVRIFFRPLINWLWIAGFMLSLSGILSAYFYFKKIDKDKDYAF